MTPNQDPVVGRMSLTNLISNTAGDVIAKLIQIQNRKPEFAAIEGMVDKVLQCLHHSAPIDELRKLHSKLPNKPIPNSERDTYASISSSLIQALRGNVHGLFPGSPLVDKIGAALDTLRATSPECQALSVLVFNRELDILLREH